MAGAGQQQDDESEPPVEPPVEPPQDDVSSQEGATEGDPESSEEPPDEDAKSSGSPSSPSGVPHQRPLNQMWRKLRPALGTAQSRILDYPRPLRLGIYVALLPALVFAVVGAWQTLRSESGSELEPHMATQAVREFFLAQRTGDCERLIEVVSEASWSDDGGRTREEFLDQCDEALEDYELDIDSVSLDFEYAHNVEKGEPPASVTYSGGREAQGHLVNEDGVWQVELDEDVLRIGRSVEDTLQGYITAYNNGDCDRLVTYLSDDAWSGGGGLSRDEFVEGCAALVEARDGSTLEAPLTLEMHPGADPGGVAYRDDTASVEVSLYFEDEIEGYIPGAEEPERARLVKEGLLWKIDGSEALPDDAAEGPPLRALRYVELQARLMNVVDTEATIPGEARCHEYEDRTPSLEDIEVRDDVDVALQRAFGDIRECEVYVTLYRFTGDDEALSAAEAMAAEKRNEELPTVEELEAEGNISDPESYVERRRPNQEAAIPGLPEVHGYRSLCYVDGCSNVGAFVSRGDVVVQVQVAVDRSEGSSDDDLGQVADVMQAQLDRL